MDSNDRELFYTAADRLRDFEQDVLAQKLDAALRSLESAEPVAYGLKNAITGEWCGTAFVPTKDAEGYDHDALLPLYTTPQPAKAQVPEVNELAQIIREVDGNHSLGAGALAEAIIDKLTAAPNPPQEGWVKISERLPVAGRKVLAHYKNALGKSRRIVAFYAPAMTIEDDGENALDFGDYSKEKDAFCLPQGWYECIDNNDEYSYMRVIVGSVDSWTPLPHPPQED